MPSEQEKATGSPPDVEATAIVDASASASLRGGHGDRFEEDAFDYPSASHSWSSGETPTGSPEAAGPEPEASKTRGSRRGHSRDEGGRQRAAVRHRPALMAAAALVLLAGFGLALATVSDTVSPNPHPGGTAPASAPKTPALPPDATVPAEPPGDAAGTGAWPTQTSPPPRSDDHQDDEHGREDQEREDDDRSED